LTRKRIVGLCSFVIGLGSLILSFEIVGTGAPEDWSTQFYAAALNWRHPYEVPGFYNMPWLVWLLRPLAMLGAHYSYTSWVIVTTLLLVWSMQRLGADLTSIILCIISPYYYYILINGNVDALSVAGVALLEYSPGVGALFLLIKPQELALVLLGAHYQRRDVAILTIALLVAFVLHGPWPIDFALAILNHGPQGQWWNCAIFPYGLPFAAGLVAIGLTWHDPALLAAACPFASPYVTGIMFFPVLCLLLPRLSGREQFALIAVAWISTRIIFHNSLASWCVKFFCPVGTACSAPTYVYVHIALGRILTWCGYGSTIYAIAVIVHRDYPSLTDSVGLRRRTGPT